jgi:nucleotide-binding universal stress UspA family protein
MTEKPILLATDGSPSAAEATLEAIELARAMETSLVVVSVDHAAWFVGGGALYTYTDVLADLRGLEHERIEEALGHACAVAAEAGVDCEAVHADDEAGVAEQICRIAAARKARMIVIGAHGWSPTRRVLHGSVSTAVVHEAHRPVLVVPSGSVPSEHVPDNIVELVRTRQPA